MSLTEGGFDSGGHVELLGEVLVFGAHASSDGAFGAEDVHDRRVHDRKGILPKAPSLDAWAPNTSTAPSSSRWPPLSKPPSVRDITFLSKPAPASENPSPISSPPSTTPSVKRNASSFQRTRFRFKSNSSKKTS